MSEVPLYRGAQKHHDETTQLLADMQQSARERATDTLGREQAELQVFFFFFITLKLRVG